jgi:hypothetical protein
MVNGVEFTNNGTTFSTDRFNFTASGQYFERATAIAQNWYAKGHRTDAAYPVTMFFYFETPDAFSPGSYLFSNNDGTTPLGFDIRLNTSGIPQFAQYGDSNLNRLVSLTVTPLATNTLCFVAVKWQMSASNTLFYSLNGGAWSSAISITPRAATADNDGVGYLGRSGGGTNYLQTGAALLDVGVAEALLTDQQIADIYAAVIARH